MQARAGTIGGAPAHHHCLPVLGLDPNHETKIKVAQPPIRLRRRKARGKLVQNPPTMPEAACVLLLLRPAREQQRCASLTLRSRRLPLCGSPCITPVTSSCASEHCTPMRTRLSTWRRACRCRSSSAAPLAALAPPSGSGASAAASSWEGLFPSTHSVTSTRRVVYRHMMPGTAGGDRQGRSEGKISWCVCKPGLATLCRRLVQGKRRWQAAGARQQS